MFGKLSVTWQREVRGGDLPVGTLLVYEDVRSGKVQAGVEVGVGVGVPTARQKLGLLGRGRLHR